jgi:mannose-6-phosphate isomerase-like protein (cupin superfamily)
MRAKGLLTGATVAGAVFAAGAAFAQADGTPAHRTAAELRAAVAATKDGVALSPLPTGTATTMIARRTKTGEIEVHTGLNDVFVAHDGHATVIVGEAASGNHEVSPGEWRGGTMSGATRYEMSPGDVLWIPAGRPHQVVVTGKEGFNYLALKYPSAKK